MSHREPPPKEYSDALLEQLEEGLNFFDAEMLTNHVIAGRRRPAFTILKRENFTLAECALLYSALRTKLQGRPTELHEVQARENWIEAIGAATAAKASVFVRHGTAIRAMHCDRDGCYIVDGREMRLEDFAQLWVSRPKQR